MAGRSGACRGLLAGRSLPATSLISGFNLRRVEKNLIGGGEDGEIHRAIAHQVFTAPSPMTQNRFFPAALAWSKARSAVSISSVAVRASHG